MKRLALAVLATALAVFLAPSLALAKGPIEASIDGPGLDSPITFGGSWNEDAMAPHQPLMQFAEAAGFFPAVFRREPDPMLSRRPAGELGPRYVVTYRVPGPNGEEDVLYQHLYPYAKPALVSYMEPGQTVFGGQKTNGGWFVALPQLKETLVSAGLPASSPTGADGSPFPWTIVGALAVLAAAVGLGSAAFVAIRRRPHPAT